MDWVANTLLIVCWYWYPRRWAVMTGAAGSLIYALIGWRMGWYGLVFIELLLATLQVRACLLENSSGGGQKTMA